MLDQPQSKGIQGLNNMKPEHLLLKLRNPVQPDLDMRTSDPRITLTE